MPSDSASQSLLTQMPEMLGGDEEVEEAIQASQTTQASQPAHPGQAAPAQERKTHT